MIIQYNKNSDLFISTQMGMITTHLNEKNFAKGYIESSLVINLKKEVTFGEVHLKCLINNSIKEKTVLIRDSGMTFYM